MIPFPPIVTVPVTRRQLSIGRQSVVHLRKVVDVHGEVLTTGDDSRALTVHRQRGDLQWTQRSLVRSIVKFEIGEIVSSFFLPFFRQSVCITLTRTRHTLLQYHTSNLQSPVPIYSIM